MVQMRVCRSCGKKHDINKDCECKEKRDREYREKRNEYQKAYAEENPEVVKPLKTARWRRLRKNIISRDGGHCQRCLIKYGIINSDNLQGHHIIARVHRPDLIFDPQNVITLCASCNYELGTGGLDFEPDKGLMADTMEPNI